ncbi:MAG: histone deacetylase family protein, partial [Anaerolineae bacterium]|nr:histone deacetylase family protein [Anaerolineae bacterium]
GGADAPGTTLNLPLAQGTDERAYLMALEQALSAIQEFTPTALVISLGFETYRDDPLTSFRLEKTSFHSIGQRIADLSLPTLYVQEGGYSVEGVGDCAVEFFRGVLESA